MLSVSSFVVDSTVVQRVDNLHCVTPSHLAQENSTVTVTLTGERSIFRLSQASVEDCISDDNDTGKARDLGRGIR